MSSITIEISGTAAEKLRKLVALEQRTETEIVSDALEAYIPVRRRLPKGTGKYRSGQTDISRNAEDLLRDAVKEGRWP
jgi:hypothetical protein